MNQYGNVRSHIFLMDNMPALTQAYRILLQEQRHGEISNLTPIINEPATYVADRNRSQQF